MQEIGFVEPAERLIIRPRDQKERAGDGPDAHRPVRFRRAVQRPLSQTDRIPERQRIAPGAALFPSGQAEDPSTHNGGPGGVLQRIGQGRHRAALDDAVGIAGQQQVAAGLRRRAVHGRTEPRIVAFPDQRGLRAGRYEPVDPGLLTRWIAIVDKDDLGDVCIAFQGVEAFMQARTGLVSHHEGADGGQQVQSDSRWRLDSRMMATAASARLDQKASFHML